MSEDLKVKLLEDRVMIRPQTRNEGPTKQLESGLLVVDDRPDNEWGEVVAVGPEVSDRPDPDLEVGDEVLFGRYAGTEVQIGPEEFVVTRLSELVVKR